MEKRRIAVTGLGAVSPVGNSAGEAWNAVKNGISGIDRITLFDAARCPVQIAGEVKQFNALDYGIEKPLLRKTARFSQLALAAGIQAVKDSGYDAQSLQKERTGVCIGNCLGGMEAIDEGYRKFLNPSAGPSRIPPLTIPLAITNQAAASISIFFALHGPSLTAGTACSSGTDAIGTALDMIRSGRIDVCIAGGTESAVTEFAVASLAQLQALTLSGNENPKKASRPFDISRNGFVLSEGAAVLILEEYGHAQRRGAKIYAECAGYGQSCDAYHITSPCPDGSGAAAAVENALHDAGLHPSSIDYYNAHGTSTVPNDSAESKMIKSVFKSHAQHMSISSTKSMTGHLVGAAGALEAIFCIQAIQDGFVPPTINLEHPDIEGGCDLNYTPHTGVRRKIKAAASASLGFGGHNSCIIFTSCCGNA